jgi:shikimate kinase
MDAPPKAPVLVNGHIYLIGMMGAGKSTVAKLLSQLLKRPFVDTDKRIAEQAGVNVADIFEYEGESGFRARERQALQELKNAQKSIVATGGGLVIDPLNRLFLRETGTTVYLQASPEELWRRVKRDRSRPLLQTSNPEARLRELLAARHPIYFSCADVIVTSDDRGAQHLVEKIHQKLELSLNPHHRP